MKKIIIASLFLAILYAFGCQEKDSFSEKALSEKLVGWDGMEVSFQSILEKHKGKPVVIEVWASWCSDCVKAMPSFKTLQKENQEVDYIFISLDKSVDKWKLGVDKHQLDGDQYFAKDGMKGAFGKAIDLDWIPRYIVIDKKGKVVLYRAIEKDFDKIKTTLESIKN